MPSTSALPAVWSAVYAALDVTAITSTLGCAVYDHVPQTPTFPYLRLQSPTNNPLRAMGNFGGDTTVQLHIFTSADQHRGAGKAQAILSKCGELLDNASLLISGFTLHGVLLENEFDAGDEEVNGVPIKHYVGVFRVYTRAA